jgi:hypothetical protein
LYAQLFNAANDEDKDFPRVDPNNIDFDAVQKYLLEQPTRVPNVKFNKAAIYNTEDRNRAFYEPIRLQTLMNYHPAAVKRATDFYTGALEGKEEIEEANQADIKKDLGVANITPNISPVAGVQQTTPGTTANRIPPGMNPNQQNVGAQNYAAAFPNDPLGQMIATRNAQQA